MTADTLPVEDAEEAVLTKALVEQPEVQPDRPAQRELSDAMRARISPALQTITLEVEAGIVRCSRSRELPRTVSLSRMRNLSHASVREFDAMRARLATLLTAAAQAQGSPLTFIAEEADEAPFVMLGAAYLVTLEGFDSWELYLSVTRVDRSHDLWRSEGPVRVLRFEQPMSAQVFYSGADRP